MDIHTIIRIYFADGISLLAHSHRNIQSITEKVVIHHTCSKMWTSYQQIYKTKTMQNNDCQTADPVRLGEQDIRANVVHSVKRFERSNGLDTALYTNYLYILGSQSYIRWKHRCWNQDKDHQGKGSICSSEEPGQRKRSARKQRYACS